MNAHQKAVRRPGERRVGRDQIAELLEKSRSDDPEERCEAAQFLCPCHVRRRIDPVWEALYRMLEDQEVRVRRAAWHTLEDGGRPDDPALDAILARAEMTETDPTVRRLMALVTGPCREREKIVLDARGRDHRRPGKCDFCGRENVRVEPEYRTTVGSGGSARAAHVCGDCARTL